MAAAVARTSSGTRAEPAPAPNRHPGRPAPGPASTRARRQPTGTVVGVVVPVVEVEVGLVVVGEVDDVLLFPVGGVECEVVVGGVEW